MSDSIFYLSKILKYLEGVVNQNNLEGVFADKISEQKENIEDLEKVLNKFKSGIVDLDTYEDIRSDETTDKIMLIHKFIADLQWHISEIDDLNVEIMKLTIKE